MKKLLVLLLVVVVSGAVFAGGEQEEEWPAKTIEIVVPYNPGGDTDLTARAFTDPLNKVLDNPVVVRNMAGAAGSVASRHVKDARADGYTVLFYHPSFFMNKLAGQTDYDHHDFEIVAVPAFADTDLLTVNADSEYQTLGDYINKAEANPGEVEYAASVGAYSFIQGVAIEEAADVEFNKVDIGGGAEKMAAILGGHLEASVFIVSMIQDYLDSGEMRALAQYGPERSQYIPDIPTLREEGIDVAFEKFYFMAMPKGTPEAVVQTFAEAVREVTESEEFAGRFEDVFATARFIGGDEAVEYMDNEWDYYEELWQSYESR